MRHHELVCRSLAGEVGDDRPAGLAAQHADIEETDADHGTTGEQRIAEFAVMVLQRRTGDADEAGGLREVPDLIEAVLPPRPRVDLLQADDVRAPPAATGR